MAISTSDKKSIFDGRKMWFFFAALAAIVTAGVIFTLLSTVAATSTYWVVKEGVTVQPREPITSDMIEAVSVPRSAAPKNIVTEGQIKAAEGGDAADDYYAKYVLTSGDIITSSNAGPLVDFGGEFQAKEGMVYASFKSNPSLATGGTITAGSLVDVAIIYDAGGVYASRFFLSGVEVVQATVDLDGAGATTDGEGTSGAPMLYTLSVTPQQAAALAVATKYDIYVVRTADNKTNVDGVNSSLDSILSDQTNINNTPVVTAPTASPSPSATSTPSPTATPKS